MRHAWNLVAGNGAAAGTLALVAIAAWLCFIPMTLAHHSAPAMPGMTMPSGAHESFAAVFAMWEAMAVAMMAPTLAFPLLADASARRGPAFVLVFAVGYLGVWSVFALLAAAAQRELEGSTRWLPLALLAAGGAYQWTRLKKASLDECRKRVTLMTEDTAAIVAGGIRYGLCCLGCCWLLMALMVAAGMGSLAVAFALTLAMFAERLLPRARYATGVACVVLAAGAAAVQMLNRGF